MAELIMQACPERGTTVEAYAPIIGQAQLDDFKRLGEALSDLRIQHVNSTAAGGGVAELLNRIVPMMNELGVETRWDVINGTDRFYEITKAFHNGLHGRPVQLSAKIFSDFRECSRAFAHEFQVQGNAVLIHDPQPIGLIRKRPTRGDVWAWRCHVDVSQPNATIWRFLEKFITRYDACVFSAAHFSKRVPVRQFLIAPSIDPLAEKNRDLTDADVDHVFERLQIPRDLPIVTQVSRFDYLKDPVGVVRMFRAVKKYAKCRLVLAGGGAADDPEGAQVLAETREAAGTDPLIHLLELPVGSDFEINALQRGSTILLQKSLREGFALTVTEALWKQKPVVASAIGGIPLQVIHRFSGLLSHSIDTAALAVRHLLANPALGVQLGKNAKEHVRNNFLITRHMREHMLLFQALRKQGDILTL